MSLAVVGAAHKNADGSSRLEEIFRCEPGEAVLLIPEPENEHDRHAIAVFSCRNVQLGYVSAERAPRIGTLMGSMEIRSIFQRPTSFGAWIRLAFDGEAPMLTPSMIEEHEEPGERSPRTTAQDEPDFYPDEKWPDD